jgi:hypothetical protein
MHPLAPAPAAGRGTKPQACGARRPRRGARCHPAHGPRPPSQSLLMPRTPRCKRGRPGDGGGMAAGRRRRERRLAASSTGWEAGGGGGRRWRGRAPGRRAAGRKTPWPRGALPFFCRATPFLLRHPQRRRGPVTLPERPAHPASRPAPPPGPTDNGALLLDPGRGPGRRHPRGSGGSSGGGGRPNPGCALLRRARSTSAAQHCRGARRPPRAPAAHLVRPARPRAQARPRRRAPRPPTRSRAACSAGPAATSSSRIPTRTTPWQ